VTGGKMRVSGCGDGDGVLASIDKPGQAEDCSESSAPMPGCALGMGLVLQRDAGGEGAGEGRKDGAAEEKREGDGGADERRGQLSSGRGTAKEELRTLAGGARAAEGGTARARL
jgi:hypothetical protein